MICYSSTAYHKDRLTSDIITGECESLPTSHLVYIKVYFTIILLNSFSEYCHHPNEALYCATYLDCWKGWLIIGL